MPTDAIDYTQAFAVIVNARNPIGALRAFVEKEREAERARIVRWLRDDIAHTRAYADTPECGPNRKVVLDIAGAYEMVADDIEKSKHLDNNGAPNAD